MTYEETLEELKFAIKHNIRFNKHNVERILPKEDVERAAKELCLYAEYRPLFLNDKACYVLIFGDVGNYYSKYVISSDDSYVIDSKTNNQSTINENNRVENDEKQ